MQRALRSFPVGALLMLLSGCAVGSVAAPSIPSAFVSSNGAVHLQGSIATQQTLGHEGMLHLHLRSDIGWPEAALLALQGRQRWRVHVSLDSSGSPEGVGSCAGQGEEAPFVLREEATGKLYVQMPPYFDCTADLGITPVQKGKFLLTVSVLKRFVADRDGVHLLKAGEYATPYRLRRTAPVRGVQLQWRITVTG